MEFKSPVQPALTAVESLRKDIGTRIGKEGGNLNRLQLSRLDIIETTLLQVESVRDMMNLARNQMEIAQHGFRTLERLHPAPAGLSNGDDGSSETKGQ